MFKTRCCAFFFPAGFRAGALQIQGKSTLAGYDGKERFIPARIRPPVPSSERLPARIPAENRLR